MVLIQDASRRSVFKAATRGDMRYSWLATMLLTACTGSQTSHAMANLTISIGNDVYSLQSEVSSDETNDRLLIRSSNANVTAMLSIPRPIEEGVIAVDESSVGTTVWAKRATQVPLVASKGMITARFADGQILSLTLSDVAKDADQFGESLLIVGSIDTLRLRSP
jgi:hypothetical protein